MTSTSQEITNRAKDFQELIKARAKRAAELRTKKARRDGETLQ